MSHKSFLDYVNIVNFNEDDPENYFVHEKTLSQKHERYVYLVKNKNDGKTYAMKVTSVKNQIDQERVKKETILNRACEDV